MNKTEEQLKKLDDFIETQKGNNFDMILSGMRALNDRIDIQRDRLENAKDHLRTYDVRVDKAYHRLGELIEKITSYEIRLLTMEKLLKITNHYGEDLHE